MRAAVLRQADSPVDALAAWLTLSNEGDVQRVYLAGRAIER